MCELPPFLGAVIIGLSIGFFALGALKIATSYKEKMKLKEVETSND